MNDPEYAKLEKVERDHWYYAGKRDIVRHWINRYRPLGLSDTLLDYGAGTGFLPVSGLGNAKFGFLTLTLNPRNSFGAASRPCPS